MLRLDIEDIGRDLVSHCLQQYLFFVWRKRRIAIGMEQLLVCHDRNLLKEMEWVMGDK